MTPFSCWSTTTIASIHFDKFAGTRCFSKQLFRPGTHTSMSYGGKKKIIVLPTNHRRRFRKKHPFTPHGQQSAVIFANRMYKFERRFFSIKNAPAKIFRITFLNFVRILRLRGLCRRLFVAIYFFLLTKNKTTPLPPNIRPYTRPHPLCLSFC